MGHATSTGRPVRASHRVATTAALALLTMGAHAQGSLLRAEEGAYQQHTAAEYALTSNRSTNGSLRVFGDYYFFDASQGSMGPTLGPLVGGLRASTGLVGLSQPLSLYDARPEKPHCGNWAVPFMNNTTLLFLTRSSIRCWTSDMVLLFVMTGRAPTAPNLRL